MNHDAGAELSVLVIGYGNTLRGDDGAGPKVAEEIERLNLPNVRALSLGLLAPEIADPVSKAGKVIFVDASAEANEVSVSPVAPGESSQVMAHAAEPATILALARDLFGRAPNAWLVAIPACDFSPGENFSQTTARGVKTAVDQITRLISGPRRSGDASSGDCP